MPSQRQVQAKSALSPHSLASRLLHVPFVNFPSSFRSSIISAVDSSSNARVLHRLCTAWEHAKRTVRILSATLLKLTLFSRTLIFIHRSLGPALNLPGSLQEHPQTCGEGTPKIDKNSIHEIVLVGGSTHIPCIVKLVLDF